MAFVRSALANRPSDSSFVPEIAAPRRKPRIERRTEALAIIDSRSLERECFVRSIRLSHPGLSVEGYASVDDWSEADHDADPVAILYSVGTRRPPMPPSAARSSGSSRWPGRRQRSCSPSPRISAR